MTVLRVIKKYKMILSSHQIKRIIQLLAMMIIGGLLEMCSVSLIVPFMTFVMNPDEMMKNTYVKFCCDLLGISSSNAFILLISVVMAILFVFKNLFLIFQYNMQFRFVYNNMYLMQSEMLEKYLCRPYEYFLNINSAEIIRIINSDTVYAFNTLIVLLQLFAEFVVSAMIGITLFVIAPSITIFIVLIFYFLVVLINIIIKPILKKAGRNQQKAGTGMTKWLIQSLEGIKDLKVTDTESYFKNKFDKSGYDYSQALRKNQTLSFIPRYMIEGVAFGAIFIYIAIIISNGVNLSGIMPMLSAVAIAAIRLLPSINRISGSFAQIEYNEPMIDKMIENITNINSGNKEVSGCSQRNDKEVFRFDKSLRFENVVYKYPNSEDYILNNVDFEIKKNTSVGIVGASGSGKSTAVDLLLGLLRPSSGRIFIDEIDIRENLEKWHEIVGYIPQTVSMIDDTIRANIAFGISENEINDEKIWRALNDAALADFVKNLPQGLDTEIGERGVRLSGGQRQRIGIARALYRNSSVLVFDEATSALDSQTEAEIMNSIYDLKNSKTIIIIAHRTSTLDRCNEIYEVKNGTINRK